MEFWINLHVTAYLQFNHIFCKYIFPSAYFAQSNGRAEVAVKAMKRLIEENMGINGSSDNDKIVRALLQQRNKCSFLMSLNSALQKSFLADHYVMRCQNLTNLSGSTIVVNCIANGTRRKRGGCHHCVGMIRCGYKTKARMQGGQPSGTGKAPSLQSKTMTRCL